MKKNNHEESDLKQKEYFSYVHQNYSGGGNLVSFAFAIFAAFQLVRIIL